MYRVFGTMILSLAIGAICLGQDLGSSNKLFGGDKPAKPPAVKRAAAKPKTAPAKAKPTVAKAKPAAVKAKPAVSKATAAAKEPEPSKATAAVKAKPVLKPAAKAVAAKTIETKAPAKVEPARPDKLSPEKIESLIAEANAARDGRDALKAEELYRKALAGAPDYVYVKIALSDLLSRPVQLPEVFDRYEEAEKLARAATEKEPNNAIAHDQLGLAMEARGFTGDETEAEYRRAIALDASYAPAYAHLGRLMRRQRKDAEASGFYSDALDRAKDAKNIVAIAAVLQSEQRFADSVGPLRRALRYEPKNTAAIDLLGRALTAASNFGEAERFLRSSIAADERNTNAYILLADLYGRQSELGMAENALLQAARFAVGYDRLRLAGEFERLGDLFAKDGNRIASVRSYRQSLTYVPDRASVLAKLTARK